MIGASGALFGNGELLCLIKDCGWRTQVNPNHDGFQGLDIVNAVMTDHLDQAHPNHQLQVQKCPLRGCGWEERAYSLPGDDYSADRVRLQKKWSHHMNEAHPTVRGPETIQVVMELYPPGVVSSDGREIAPGALHDLPEDGVPIVSARGELVGRVHETREENGWLIAEGFLREDLINKRDADSLWRGRILPVSFAVRPDPHTIQGDRPFYTIAASLLNVRVTEGDETVWEGTGMRALHPKLAGDLPAEETEPPARGETESVNDNPVDQLAIKAAMQGLNGALQPLQHMLEEWGRTLAPAVQALAEALTAVAKNIQVKPEPMRIVPGPGFEDRIRQMSETVLSPRDWRSYIGQVPPGEWRTDPESKPLDLDPQHNHVASGPYGGCPACGTTEAQLLLEGDDEVSTPIVSQAEFENRPTPPEGLEDWPRLPRDGKRAPTGCEVCEAPVDGRHPRHCPGA